MTVDDPKGAGHYVEKHEPGQSLLNYNFDFLQNFEIYWQSNGYTEVPTSIETVSIKKSTYDCYEDNSMKMNDCINEYIAEQMNCYLPWAKQHSEMNLELCSGPEKLELFRNISFHITSSKYKSGIREKGCLKPNCVKKKWTKVYHEVWPAWGNNTVIIQAVPDTATTLRRKEIRLADFSTFMADCGSYLGLFLGASILSLSDIGITLVKKVHKIMKWKKKEHRIHRKLSVI